MGQSFFSQEKTFIHGFVGDVKCGTVILFIREIFYSQGPDRTENEWRSKPANKQNEITNTT